MAIALSLLCMVVMTSPVKLSLDTSDHPCGMEELKEQCTKAERKNYKWTEKYSQWEAKNFEIQGCLSKDETIVVVSNRFITICQQMVEGPSVPPQIISPQNLAGQIFFGWCQDFLLGWSVLASICPS